MMSGTSESVFRLWVYLQTSPLLWLCATLGAYTLGAAAQKALRGNPLVNPVAVAVALLVPALWASRTPYQTYFAGAQFVHFLLGPATVALAVPLYHNRAQVRRALFPMAAALVAGSATAAGSAVLIAWGLGASPETIASLAPKSVTSPIAMAVAEQIGGLPSLSAALVILTGILGAIIGFPLLRAVGVHDPQAQGFALGTACHGIGTARAFQVDPMAGTFAGIAMGLNGLITALCLPGLAQWMGHWLQLIVVH